MTVRELIEDLLDYPRDATVFVTGADRQAVEVNATGRDDCEASVDEMLSNESDGRVALWIGNSDFKVTSWFD